MKMAVTAYDIALNKISRIPIYCEEPDNCTETEATAEIQRVIKSHNRLNYIYPASALYVYKLDKVYKKSGLVIAQLIKESEPHQPLNPGEFIVQP